MPYKICRVYRYEFFSQKCKSFTTLVILYTQQVCFTMGRNSLYYFLYGRVCYQTSRLLVSLQRMESNLRKLFILLLSLLTLLFVWHILLCWNKNVNNHWVESESNLRKLFTLLFVFTAKKRRTDPIFSTRHALFLYSPINRVAVED